MNCSCGKHMMQSSMKKYTWFCLDKTCGKVWKLKELEKDE